MKKAGAAGNAGVTQRNQMSKSEGFRGDSKAPINSSAHRRSLALKGPTYISSLFCRGRTPSLINKRVPAAVDTSVIGDQELDSFAGLLCLIVGQMA